MWVELTDDGGPLDGKLHERLDQEPVVVNHHKLSQSLWFSIDLLRTALLGESDVPSS